MQPHERLEAVPEHRTLTLHATDRVRTVEDDEANACFGARLHRERHRPHEGVDPNPHVLQIEEERIEPLEHRGCRLAAPFAVERVHREPCDRVGVVLRFDHVVLLLPASAVLRAEERTEGKSCP